MQTVASGVQATAGAAAIVLLHASSIRAWKHVLIQVTNGASFEWSVDGGVVWHHVVADPNGNPLRLALEGLDLAGHTLQLRRGTATDCTGVYADGW